ncbi:FAD/NAD(P)-binding domain-containing protein [Fragilariopsis cylindrus CCMP1102]|uniref:FAD/NAD(P)-binding domain-containing protein n=1 Tax=Fragilariopsis cylindrus CCMP1102 TaxID=635003 RepID=A0A1E7EX22_9STRA|nr:FAD/NAD(P)-binding domain-containing protein [Fragilariopsis cylindrus CCMP1102]|eukprot:OEU10590.1 FAD/NAD(P)-binding domain-containing protein [Fragilariopsis cylindrus CCMP1102]
MFDCVIIGAGASGLQCCARLIEHPDVDVVVVEARDRIGGRIHTRHETVDVVTADDNGGSNNKVSFRRDLGASWVHGASDDNPMVKLLEECKTPVLKSLDPIFEGNPWIRPNTVLHHNNGDDERARKSLISFFVNGSIVDDESLPVSSTLISQALRRHYRFLEIITQNYGSEHNVHNLLSDEEVSALSPTSVVELSVDQIYKRLNKDDKVLVNLLASFYLFLIENWNGASMKDTSVEQLVENGVTFMDIDKHHDGAGDFFGPHCKVREGMITVLEPLIKIIERHQNDDGDDRSIIRLKEEVISIIDKKNHVRIEMASGKIIEAKCCVCTIPLGCLQHVIAKTDMSFFQPRLCDDKINAINSIWSGSYRKVFLTFDHIFWPKEPPMIGLIRNKPRRRRQQPDRSSKLTSVLPGCHLLLNNLWARNNIPCIEAILCGNLGVWCFEKSNEIIQQAVIEFLEASMGLNDLSSSCTDFHVTRWEEDMHTRGSYSTFRLGTTDQHVGVLQSSEWDGRLLFAGEATEIDHMGSVHGALISGNRAAADVLSLLNM